jgi:hypothetical protein
VKEEIYYLSLAYTPASSSFTEKGTGFSIPCWFFFLIKVRNKPSYWLVYSFDATCAASFAFMAQ